MSFFVCRNSKFIPKSNFSPPAPKNVFIWEGGDLCTVFLPIHVNCIVLCSLGKGEGVGLVHSFLYTHVKFCHFCVYLGGGTTVHSFLVNVQYACKLARQVNQILARIILACQKYSDKPKIGKRLKKDIAQFSLEFLGDFLFCFVVVIYVMIFSFKLQLVIEKSWDEGQKFIPSNDPYRHRWNEA